MAISVHTGDRGHPARSRPNSTSTASLGHEVVHTGGHPACSLSAPCQTMAALTHHLDVIPEPQSSNTEYAPATLSLRSTVQLLISFSPYGGNHLFSNTHLFILHFLCSGVWVEMSLRNSQIRNCHVLLKRVETLGAKRAGGWPVQAAAAITVWTLTRGIKKIFTNYLTRGSMFTLAHKRFAPVCAVGRCSVACSTTFMVMHVARCVGHAPANAAVLHALLAFNVARSSFCHDRRRNKQQCFPFFWLVGRFCHFPFTV